MELQGFIVSVPEWAGAGEGTTGLTEENRMVRGARNSRGRLPSRRELNSSSGAGAVDSMAGMLEAIDMGSETDRGIEQWAEPGTTFARESATEEVEAARDLKREKRVAKHGSSRSQSCCQQDLERRGD